MMVAYALPWGILHIDLGWDGENIPQLGDKMRGISNARQRGKKPPTAVGDPSQRSGSSTTAVGGFMLASGNQTTAVVWSMQRSGK